MGQSDIIKFLEDYRGSVDFKKRPWLSVRDIYIKMRHSRNSSGLGPMTNSVRKLRECNMIRHILMQDKNSSRRVYHYQADESLTLMKKI